MKLYHGSNVAIEDIDLSRSKPNKDFGRAFYLSSDLKQAQEMAKAKCIQDEFLNFFSTFTKHLKDVMVIVKK